MTERWMLGAFAAGALLGLAALAAEPVAGCFGLPRRWIWVAALAGSVLLPATSALAPGLLPAVRLPAWTTRPRAQTPGQGSGASEAREAAVEPRRASAQSPRRLPAAFGAAWLTASLATLCALAWSRRRLRVACGPCVGRRVGGTRVLVSERAGPLVLGVLDPEIVVPRWALDAPEECRLIVRHEREHVLAGDPWLLALASLAVAALPWSPALWWQHRRLRLAVETDCDARVLASGESRRRYGRVLLRTAARPLFLPASALAWGGPSSHLERRILAMTVRRPSHPVLRAIPFAALAFAGAAAACRAASTAPRGVDTRAGASRAVVDTTTRTEMWQGRVSTTKDLPDGQTLLTLGPDPNSHGAPGFGWRYDFSPHMVVHNGERPSMHSNVYPLVDRVQPGSPAEKAGMRTGDVILSANGVDGREMPLMPDSRPGTAYTFRVRRGREVREVHLVLAPAEAAVASPR